MIRDRGLLTLSAFDERTEGIAYGDRRLAGTILLDPVGGQGVDVVCQLPMEQYLPGVLAGELFQSWRDATHESLAIAARSYALCERFHWLPRRGFDVQADERSQVWVGGGEVSARARKAVERTRGQVLVWNRLVVPAYYSAACGGRPADATIAISSNPVNAIPPLGIPETDRRSICGCRTLGSHGSWRVSFSANEVEAALRTWADGQGPSTFGNACWPVRISVSETQASGRPSRIRLSEARGGVAEVTAMELQRALNASRKGRPIRSADYSIEVVRDGWRISGSGFGHGVGLCQYGAESMARAEAGKEAILRRYYPSAVIHRAWT